MTSESTVLGIPPIDSRGDSIVAAALAVIGFVLILGLLSLLRVGTITLAQEVPAAVATAARANAATDPRAFLLNAALAPALDPDAAPLRWVDPIPVMHCMPGSWVKVDRAPLAPGTLVPAVPFVLDWEMHGCRPFGPSGPRFTGRVRLTVFQEDWGFSAMVQPAGMHVVLKDGRPLAIVAGGVTMPQWPDDAFQEPRFTARADP